MLRNGTINRALLRQRGFTLIELLVTLAIFGFVMATITSEFVIATRRSLDQRTISKAQEQARTLLDIIAYDIRMAGAGMPIGQTNFSFTQVGKAALPLQASSDEDLIAVSFNQRGVSTATLKDFTPQLKSLSFVVADSNGFEVNDTICISDITAGDVDGLCATIAKIIGPEITIDSSYSAKAGITLEAGSEVHRITTVRYESLPKGAGVSRSWDDQALLLTPDGEFTLTYLAANGSTLKLPLTEDRITNELAGILLNVSVKGERDLASGEAYIAQLQQRIALRNSLLNR